jgi:uncharacterized damage-inducible protein DinB
MCARRTCIRSSSNLATGGRGPKSKPRFAFSRSSSAGEVIDAKPLRRASVTSGASESGATALRHESILWAMSPIEKLELPPKQRAANEADTVWAMLDFYRTTLVRKCAGLSDDDLRSRCIPPSNLSLMGILRHMADVEVYWFGQVFGGDEVTYAYDPEMIGADFDDLSESSGKATATTFFECVARSKAITNDVNLDTLSAKRPGDEPINLRYIVVHLIEEYARHCGHADLLREVLDGETGE